MKSYILLFMLEVCFAMPILPAPGTVVPIDVNEQFISPFNRLDESVENALGAVAKAKTVTISPNFPDSGRKYAILEQKGLESAPIQLDDKYGNIQNFVAGLYQPKPIVDTIEEYEKYGNDGGKHRQIGTALVGGYEAFSNILNAAAELPFAAIRQFGKKITTSLNSVGGKLVGLS